MSRLLSLLWSLAFCALLASWLIVRFVHAQPTNTPRPGLRCVRLPAGAGKLRDADCNLPNQNCVTANPPCQGMVNGQQFLSCEDFVEATYDRCQAREDHDVCPELSTHAVCLTFMGIAGDANCNPPQPNLRGPGEYAPHLDCIY
jgi:hypothetical protein